MNATTFCECLVPRTSLPPPRVYTLSGGELAFPYTSNFPNVITRRGIYPPIPYGTWLRHWWWWAPELAIKLQGMQSKWFIPRSTPEASKDATIWAYFRSCQCNYSDQIHKHMIFFILTVWFWRWEDLNILIKRLLAYLKQIIRNHECQWRLHWTQCQEGRFKW